jgi:hypothetical protein
MSDFKPGGCNNETLCVLVLLAKGGLRRFWYKQILCVLLSPGAFEAFGIFYVNGTEHTEQ